MTGKTFMSKTNVKQKYINEARKLCEAGTFMSFYELDKDNKMNLPLWLIVLAENIFLNTEDQDFPLAFIRSVPVNIETTGIFESWFDKTMLNKKYGIINSVDSPEVKKVLRKYKDHGEIPMRILIKALSINSKADTSYFKALQASLFSNYAKTHQSGEAATACVKTVLAVKNGADFWKWQKQLIIKLFKG